VTPSLRSVILVRAAQCSSQFRHLAKILLCCPPLRSQTPQLVMFLRRKSRQTSSLTNLRQGTLSLPLGAHVSRVTTGELPVLLGYTIGRNSQSAYRFSLLCRWPFMLLKAQQLERRAAQGVVTSLPQRTGFGGYVDARSKGCT